MDKQIKGMTYADLVRHYFPEATDDFIDYILWERTGYPAFYITSKSYPTPLSVLRRQLRQQKYRLLKKVKV